ncbi:hypothetical protein [Devosia sp. MC521]|uniref:hypothetical protein n=1 Tax=Devosia sp. MC521 TaxID=2759954 RepID=UPI0015F7E0E6|nr:hypothetical protein [Devosia sp. MC521]MBJ6986899.1 hypothetical protein [Devosia sp. MC521]QMW63925.1 hypothetical protein H4N61_06305 [Devosia sp. MC521]
MRKPNQTERNALAMVKRCGGSYCPSQDACAEPFIMDTLNGLVRKKYLSVSAEDGAPPMFKLTAYGEREAVNG